MPSTKSKLEKKPKQATNKVPVAAPQIKSDASKSNHHSESQATAKAQESKPESMDDAEATTQGSHLDSIDIARQTTATQAEDEFTCAAAAESALDRERNSKLTTKERRQHRRQQQQIDQCVSEYIEATSIESNSIQQIPSHLMEAFQLVVKQYCGTTNTSQGRCEIIHLMANAALRQFKTPSLSYIAALNKPQPQFTFTQALIDLLSIARQKQEQSAAKAKHNSDELARIHSGLFSCAVLPVTQQLHDLATNTANKKLFEFWAQDEDDEFLDKLPNILKELKQSIEQIAKNQLEMAHRLTTWVKSPNAAQAFTSAVQSSVTAGTAMQTHTVDERLVELRSVFQTFVLEYSQSITSYFKWLTEWRSGQRYFETHFANRTIGKSTSSDKESLSVLDAMQALRGECTATRAEYELMARQISGGLYNFPPNYWRSLNEPVFKCRNEFMQRNDEVSCHNLQRELARIVISSARFRVRCRHSAVCRFKSIRQHAPDEAPCKIEAATRNFWSSIKGREFERLSTAALPFVEREFGLLEQAAQDWCCVLYRRLIADQEPEMRIDKLEMENWIQRIKHVQRRLLAVQDKSMLRLPCYAETVREFCSVEPKSLQQQIESAKRLHAQQQEIMSIAFHSNRWCKLDAHSTPLTADEISDLEKFHASISDVSSHQMPNRAESLLTAQTEPPTAERLSSDIAQPVRTLQHARMLVQLSMKYKDEDKQRQAESESKLETIN